MINTKLIENFNRTIDRSWLVILNEIWFVSWYTDNSIMDHGCFDWNFKEKDILSLSAHWVIPYHKVTSNVEDFQCGYFDFCTTTEQPLSIFHSLSVFQLFIWEYQNSTLYLKGLKFEVQMVLKYENDGRTLSMSSIQISALFTCEHQKTPKKIVNERMYRLIKFILNKYVRL